MIKVNKGLYVHIPFCDHICGYCDFARGHYEENLADKYLLALKCQIESKDLCDIETIYIGGGTPTSLNLKQLTFLLETLKPYTKNIKEYTVEANPESLTLAKAQLFYEYGIKRVSMGMQVSQSNLLEIIERKHSFEDVSERVKILKSVGINDISIDLMYGIPSQTLNDLKESLEKIVTLDITHVSLYGLTIEPNSKFGKKGYKEADADLDADMYEYALDFLTKANFNRYEISNFAKAGFESLHNKVYWTYEDFVGVGLFASGKEANIRYTNTRSLKDYSENNFDGEKIILSKDDQIFEYIMMNLRLSKGFELASFKKRFDLDFEVLYKDEIADLLAKGLLEISDKHVKASDYGLEILHNVIEQFMNESD